MKLAIFNVKYSPNLGDGLLTECLEKELASGHPDLKVVSLDLAGRHGYSRSSGGLRELQLRILAILPRSIRLALAGFVLRRRIERRLRPGWRPQVQAADAVIVGGGNLIADADLNFPLKIAGALAEAQTKPVAVFGVGVTDNWSRPGAALFSTSLAEARLCHVAVRDAQSKEVWDRRLKGVGVREAEVCRDPGLLASLHFGARSAPFRVGLCITSPVALKYHSPAGQRFDELERWNLELVRLASAKGWPVALFTNGSPEDVTYLRQIGPSLCAISGVTIAKPFHEPADLAGFISSCGLIFAHRMHACIAAYSYGVPHIGLAWDRKLDSFFASVERPEYIIDPAAVTAAAAIDLGQRSVEQGISPETRARILDEARADVSTLLASLRQAVAS